MPPITIYTTDTCPYCHRALRLLRSKGAAFDQIDVTGNKALRQEMSLKAGGQATVPQIWIGDKHIGGSDELHALDADGQLDRLLMCAETSSATGTLEQ